jgi:hypothetical protein
MQAPAPTLRGLFGSRKLGALTNQAWPYGDPNFRGLGDAGDDYNYGVNVDAAISGDYSSTSGGGVVGGPSYSGGSEGQTTLQAMGSSPVPGGSTTVINTGGSGQQQSSWGSFLQGAGQGSAQGIVGLVAGSPLGQFFKSPTSSGSSVPWGTIALAGAGLVVVLALLKRKPAAPSAG